MNDRPTVLIVGTGSIGERHLRCFAATGRVETALCEINGELRREVAERYGIRQSYGDLDEALAAGPSIAVICSPADSHLPLATAAVRAGCHVLIEKPLATRPEGVVELRSEAAQRDRVLGVAYVHRAHPALQAMREALHSRRFGEPVQIVAQCGQHFPLYRPAYREIYYADRARGGGAVQDALTHIVNAGEWLVGPVEELAADVDHQVLEGVTVEDTVHVLTRHGRVMGCYNLNQHQAPDEAVLTVICRGGTLRYEYHRNRWRWMTEAAGQWQDEPAAELERDTLFSRQAEAFLDAAEGRCPPLCSVEEAEQSLRVNLAVLDSAACREWRNVASPNGTRVSGIVGRAECNSAPP